MYATHVSTTIQDAYYNYVIRISSILLRVSYKLTSYRRQHVTYTK
jgi:hypothetical protein